MKSTYLYKYLSNIYKNFNLMPFYKERIEFALLQLEYNLTFERTIASPHSLNDLGIRKDDNPSKVFYTLKNNFHFPEININQLEVDIFNLSEDRLGIFLDSYFLTIGDYSLIEAPIIHKLKNIDKLTSFESGIFISSLLASLNNNKCIDFFKRTGKLSTKLVDKITTQHRLCAYYIKRIKDNDGISKEMSILKKYILALTNNYEKCIYLALYNNLYALQLLECSVESAVIEALLDDAILMIDLCKEKLSNNKKRIDYAMRYKSQIVINKAQLYVFRNDYSNAIEIMLENIKEIKYYAPDYLAECYATIAYIYYLLEDYGNAIDFGKQAITLYLDIGSLTKAKIVRDILVSAYYKYGNETYAEKLYNLSDITLLINPELKILD